MNTRDDFSSGTKDKLARRVGFRCSNPDCTNFTSGPHSDPNKSINLGIAAHICAAAEGGPRYDSNMTPEQRRSIDNGIWLCCFCAYLIDKDTSAYPKERLHQWKSIAEAQQAQLINLPNNITKIQLSKSDHNIIGNFTFVFESNKLMGLLRNKEFTQESRYPREHFHELWYLIDEYVDGPLKPTNPALKKLTDDLIIHACDLQELVCKHSFVCSSVDSYIEFNYGEDCNNKCTELLYKYIEFTRAIYDNFDYYKTDTILKRANGLK